MHGDCSAPAQGGGFMSALFEGSEQGGEFKEGFEEERESQEF